jgi:Family of unknown function (DUF6624)
MYRLPWFMSIVLLASLGVSGCASQQNRMTTNERIARELIAMEESDQQLERRVVNNDPQARTPAFYARKERAQVANTQRCKEIFQEIGYPDESMVGEKASHAFWLLVQHADSDPAFQERVAKAMKPVVLRGQARADLLAMLTDRVRVNTNRLQIYGSQVVIDTRTGRAVPKQMEDGNQVDQRRAEVGLEPLWVYLNGMSELNFMMNQKMYEDLGQTEPWAYPEGYSDW